MRYLSALIALAVLLVLSPAPASGQDATVELRHKFSKGETLFYTTLVSVQSRSTSSRLAIRVLDLAPDGTALLELVVEDQRGPDGALLDELDDPWLFRVRPDGAIVERLLGAESMSDLLLPLPSGPVRVGESWKRSRTANESGVRTTVTQTITLEGIDAAGEMRNAQIRVRTDGRGTSRSTGSGGGSIDVRVTYRENEEIIWSIARGRILQSKSEASVTTEMFITAGDQTIPMSSSVRGAAERRLTDAASLSVPSVPAEVLITPGKAIGTALLEQSAEALAAQSGTPDAEEQQGFKAKTVRWLSGLAALLDPAEPTKVLGLLISDRKFRTEKGIGFGSSEGAVLFAYGMAPVKVGLSMPKVGDVRALVYDDQGIAFLIVAQRPKDAARSIPPTATVYGSLVFPPGGAAKIFTLP